MRKKLLKIFAVFMAMIFVLTAANSTNAQNRRMRGERISKQQTEDLLKRIEERTDHFSNQLNKSLDRSRLDGSRAEDRITDRAKDLENATDKLRRDYDFSDPRGETKANARIALNAAAAVNRIMNKRKFSSQTENSWINLRAELNTLARIYRLPTLGAR